MFKKISGSFSILGANNCLVYIMSEKLSNLSPKQLNIRLVILDMCKFLNK